MKNLLTCMLLCFLAQGLSAQNKTAAKVFPVTKAEFNKHLPFIDLVIKTGNEHKLKGVIKIKTTTKTIILKDDGEMQEYRYEGELKGSQIIVIHKLEPNTEAHYLINKQTGKIDTLLDKPNFFSNYKDFICLEGAGTDVKQRIQLGRIGSGRLIKNKFINLPNNVIPGRIYWFNQYTLMIKSNDAKYYKVKI